MEKTDPNHTHPILLFDGVCNLCNTFVQFVIQRDPDAIFRFAPLQSAIGRELSERAGLPPEELNTVVLYDQGKFYTHSDVALQVVRRLPGLWSLLYGLVILPKSLRDATYNWVARNRYRWFGKKASCMVPTPDLKRRFL
ncbi:thiol-disulfide oxidoreductase DCC family protein [Flavilitoribacter nigricans]|uniref:DUF393 domain-containing protein n=1 Tax=Flavilitoribacter nigricans (strain ATCC 23147 / DSM 23189 / NBRC 102662 / NCIMB 1420 / SS-2) TaxID=1122177 RepID=A0A2D0N7Y1_FLAN2|nr:thiol-disulfide oxidoreductase DCC family protein [Flavilitoribacter nigricans]PHN04621.1 hypothetical protein CRP01_21705 [Flavilitoribacter nigricans DSM 23189 = NBRC 102662]